MINRETSSKVSSNKISVQVDSQFLKNIIVSGSFIIVIYIALNLYFKAYLSAIFCCITFFILVPIILFLQKKEFFTYAKITIVFAGSFNILMTSYGFNTLGNTEYYFLPIMMLSLLLFEPEQKKLVAFSLFLPIFSWIILNFLPNPFINSSLLVGVDFPAEYFSSFNFIGAFSLTYMFLIHYSHAISKSNKIEIENEQTKQTASRISSLGELANGIAHEINNPLSVIVGRTELLKNKLNDMNITESDTQSCLQNLNKINDTAELITKIIKGLSAFSRDTDNDPMSSYSLNQIIQYAVELSEERIKKNEISLRVSYKTNLQIYCRDVQIIQVLNNLISNSLDAIEKLPDKWIEIKSYSDKQFIYIAVMDSGRGIPDAHVEKIMKPFFSTKETGRGIGLGLSISKGIIETHGGKLFYDKTSDNTRFVVELPIK